MELQLHFMGLHNPFALVVCYEHKPFARLMVVPDSSPHRFQIFWRLEPDIWKVHFRRARISSKS